MRLALLLIALLLLQACGGASRAQIEEAIRQAQEEAAQQEEQDAGPDPTEVALAILEECALDDVGRLLALLDVFAPLLDPAQPLPPFELAGIDTEGFALDWRLDTNDDDVPDMNGTFRFQDVDGNAVLPLSEEEIEAIETSGNLDSLPGLIENLPAGTTLVLQFTQTGSAEVVGLLGVTFESPGPLLSGTINILATTCTTAFRIRGVDATALLGDYPDADIPITVSSAKGILVGSVIMDGTPLAKIRVTYAETALEFVLDLESGTLVESQE